MRIVQTHLLNAECEEDIMTLDTVYRWSAVPAAVSVSLPSFIHCAVSPLPHIPSVSDLNPAQQDPAPLHPGTLLFMLSTSPPGSQMFNTSITPMQNLTVQRDKERENLF